MVQVITIFRTSDGMDHENKYEAEKHQRMLDLKDAFKEYQAGRPGGMSITGFFDFLETKGDLVHSYLSDLRPDRE